MQLSGYIERLRSQFAAVTDLAGDEVREVAERLVTSLESSVRLVLLEALAAAADEITLDLAPGSVHVRLRGSDPQFVVAPAPVGVHATTGVEAPPPVVAPPAEGDGPVARINFRPPESLKVRVEEAAHRDGLSVNTWLTRAAAAALDRPTPSGPTIVDRSRTGWFG